MRIGPQYKIAKRLGAQIFEKTQTRRFTLSAERSAAAKKRGRGRGGSDYSRQLIEKQKLRLTYGLTEKQFSTYVHTALASHENPQAVLFGLLETRLDSVAYRAGFAPTRRAARQLASHGHLLVNGRRSTIPSCHLSAGDVISAREGSKENGIFGGITEKLKEHKTPAWVELDLDAKAATLKSEPAFSRDDVPADIGAVFEYYTR